MCAWIGTLICGWLDEYRQTDTMEGTFSFILICLLAIYQSINQSINACIASFEAFKKCLFLWYHSALYIYYLLCAMYHIIAV